MKDKISFVVAFLGLFIALTPFKSSMEAIKLDYIFYSSNMFEILYIPLILLFLSTYIYALDYAKYGFKIFDNLAIFKYFENIANSLYFIAIFSPLLFILIYLIAQLILLIPYKEIKLDILSYVINVIAALFSLFYIIKGAWRQTKELRIAKEEKLDEYSFSAESDAQQLVENKKWNLSIVEAYRSLELAVNKKLLELGIDSTRIPITRAMDILTKNEIINRQEVEKINHIRILRNRSVHSNDNFTEDEAKEVVKIVKNILPKLETISTRGRYLERKVYDALYSEGGLFPRHHILFPSSQRDYGYDFIGDGPKYTYLIQIKSSNKINAIKNAIRQVKGFATNQNRIIIVVPDTEQKIIIDDEQVKILYFNLEKEEFSNREEIYDWIYNVE